MQVGIDYPPKAPLFLSYTFALVILTARLTARQRLRDFFLLIHLIIEDMKKEIKIFESPEFGRIRTVGDEKCEPWFIGKDVATVLGYSNVRDALLKHVDKEDKGVANCDSLGGRQKMTVINESGLYSLILSSKLPRAREFKRWVTSEVLPQIRKTGGYIPLAAEDDEKTILAKAVRILNRTLEEKDELLERKEGLLRQREGLLEAQRPKVEFADAVTTGDGCILISELAKLLTRNGYPTGRTRLFAWMRNNGYIFKRSTEPIQKWVEEGIFATSVTMIKTHHGSEERVTTKVTGKGQEYFLRKLIK